MNVYFPFGEIIYIESYDTFNKIRKEEPNLIGHFNVKLLDQSKLKIKLIKLNKENYLDHLHQ